MSFLCETGFGVKAPYRRRSLHVQRGRVALLLVLLLASIQAVVPNAAADAVGTVLVAKTADLVLGQAGFTAATGGTSTTHLNAPEAAASDGQGNLYVADTANNRVLRFPASCVSGHINGCAADLVLGQAGFTAATGGSYPNQLRGPEGMILDAQGSLFVVDTGNNRVLHYAAICLSGHTNGCAADAVLGQPNLTASSSGTNTTQLKAPEGAASDGQGGLFVADTGNNRVVHFAASCLGTRTTACAADFVLGKPSFTVRGYGASQTQSESPIGLTSDGAAGLYVADGPNRVIHFAASCLSKHANGCAADLVLGQPNFTANGYGTSASQLNAPIGLFSDSQGGLFVADMGNNRVLHFPPSQDTKPIGYVTVSTSATIVYGQPNFTAYRGGISKTQVNQPTGVALDPTGGIYVADSANNRVVHFPASCLSAHTSGCAADLVLGEPDFVFTRSGANQSQVSAASGVAVEATGGVYIADFYNNRVTHYSADCLRDHSNGCPADFVLGQPDFTSYAAGAGPSQMANPDSVAIDCAGGLYVTDRNNNRVLYFPPPASATSSRDCRLPQTLAAGIPLWVWLIVSLSVVVVAAGIGYVLVKRRRANKPATAFAEQS